MLVGPALAAVMLADNDVGIGRIVVFRAVILADTDVGIVVFRDVALTDTDVGIGRTVVFRPVTLVDTDVGIGRMVVFRAVDVVGLVELSENVEVGDTPVRPPVSDTLDEGPSVRLEMVDSVVLPKSVCVDSGLDEAVVFGDDVKLGVIVAEAVLLRKGAEVALGVVLANTVPVLIKTLLLEKPTEGIIEVTGSSLEGGSGVVLLAGKGGRPSVEIGFSVDSIGMVEEALVGDRLLAMEVDAPEELVNGRVPEIGIGVP